MKWRRKNAADRENPEDLLTASRRVETAVEDLAGRIFQDHGVTLIDLPLRELPPAVWGAKKDGSLSRLQRQIHKLAQPVIDDIVDQVAGDKLDSSRTFAVGYMARGLVISKLALMVEISRRQRDETIGPTDHVEMTRGAVH